MQQNRARIPYQRSESQRNLRHRKLNDKDTEITHKDLDWMMDHRCERKLKIHTTDSMDGCAHVTYYYTANT
jgi:hypothetical protein